MLPPVTLLLKKHSGVEMKDVKLLELIKNPEKRESGGANDNHYSKMSY